MRFIPFFKVFLALFIKMKLNPGEFGFRAFLDFLKPAELQISADFSLIERSIEMAQTGTVKWFNGTKGFGFICPDDGGQDVFVHISAVEKAGMKGLDEGQKVEYDLEDNRGRQAAGNLKAVG